MCKQYLIEKLAKEMADAANNEASENYLLLTGLELGELYSVDMYLKPATIAVNMFWPLVEAVKREGTFASYTLQQALKNMEVE